VFKTGVQSFDGTFGVQPPANTDVDLGTLVAVATAQGATTPFPTADSTPADLEVDVDAVADTPTNVTIQVQDSADANTSFQSGETGTVALHATFGDTTDGSEVHSVTVTIQAGFKVLDGAGGTVDAGAAAGTGGTVTFSDVSGTDFSKSLTVQALNDAPEGSY